MSSLTFNNNDLGDYGLTVLTSGRDLLQHQFDSMQLLDKAHAGVSHLQPLVLPVEIAVIGPAEDYYVIPPIMALSIRNLMTYIREILSQKEACELIFDIMPGRYWLARFQSLIGDFLAPGYFSGTIEFYCEDPRAFDIEETIFSCNVDVNPKTVHVGIGATAFVEPVYLLTAGNILVAATIKLENQTTDQELTWTGNLGVGDTLEIDVASWLVKKNGIASMATVEGQFPRLMPVLNTLLITGFGTLGALEITYRNTFR